MIVDCGVLWTVRWDDRSWNLARVTERFACRSDFTFVRHFVSLRMTCRCFDGNRSFGFARLQIPSQMIMSSTAKFLAKFLLTMS